MNITIENFPFRDKFGDEKAFKMIKDAGFDGVDFSFNALDSDGNWGSIDLSNHISTAKEQKKMLTDCGLSCTQAHAPFAFKYGEKMDESNKNFLDIVRSFEYASIIGAKIVVVHAVKLPPDVDFFVYNYNYYKALEPYAKKYGVKIAVENLLNSKFWLPAKLCGFINTLDSDVFCACVDVGHSEIVGVASENFISGMESGKILCVHLHDTDGQLDRHWIPFQGNHNWTNIMKALAEYGFNGDVNLEVIHSFDNLPDELYPAMLSYTATVGKYLKKLLEKYKGEIK
ncbi:MAG: sugar phosphate isomerase/epimerase [Clostridia bacterium]|nr:sugar phosphate isomerase/epimerase [Clostridia bacterium]